MKYFLITILALLFGAGVYFALSSYQAAEVVPDQNKPETPGNIRLEGSSWQWEYTDLLSGERVEAPAGGEFVLSFGPDGRIDSSTDCNQVGGTYSQDHEVLSIGQFVMTKMFCAGSMEMTYVEHLGLVNSFTLSGDTLTMNLNRDYGVMVFKRHNNQ